VEGVLVAPSDPAALAAGIERVLADPELARRLGDAGRRRADEFSWDRVAVEIEEIYRVLVG
jgi:glycosyltransferase involved in cell wall biosynthesis